MHRWRVVVTNSTTKRGADVHHFVSTTQTKTTGLVLTMVPICCIRLLGRKKSIAWVLCWHYFTHKTPQTLRGNNSDCPKTTDWPNLNYNTAFGHESNNGEGPSMRNCRTISIWNRPEQSAYNNLVANSSKSYLNMVELWYWAINPHKSLYKLLEYLLKYQVCYMHKVRIHICEAFK